MYNYFLVKNLGSRKQIWGVAPRLPWILHLWLTLLARNGHSQVCMHVDRKPSVWCTWANCRTTTGQTATRTQATMAAQKLVWVSPTEEVGLAQAKRSWWRAVKDMRWRAWKTRTCEMHNVELLTNWDSSYTVTMQTCTCFVNCSLLVCFSSRSMYTVLAVFIYRGVPLYRIFCTCIY